MIFGRHPAKRTTIDCTACEVEASGRQNDVAWLAHSVTFNSSLLQHTFVKMDKGKEMLYM